MKFTEAQLEKAFAELLGNENFPHHSISNSEFLNYRRQPFTSNN